MYYYIYTLKVKKEDMANYKDFIEEQETMAAIAAEKLAIHEKRNKRLIVEVPEEYHTDVKIRAAAKNISMRAWVSRAIIEQIKKEQQYDRI